MRRAISIGLSLGAAIALLHAGPARSASPDRDGRPHRENVRKRGAAGSTVTPASNFRRARRRLLIGMTGLTAWHLANQVFRPWKAFGAVPRSKTLGKLLGDITTHACRLAPRSLFDPAFVVDPDAEVHRTHQREVRKLLANDANFRATLRQELGSDRAAVTFDEIRVRREYVPAINDGQTCKRYAEDAIRGAMASVGESSPFDDIVVLDGSAPPALPPKGSTAAFIVHRLIKRYEVDTRFTAPSGKSVVFKTGHALASQTFGDSQMRIQYGSDGRFEPTRLNYSIWQVGTTNLATLALTPIEEAFHLLLSAHTDNNVERQLAATQDEIETTNQRKGKDLHLGFLGAVTVGDYWMAVEEAIVGGMAHQTLKQLAPRIGLPLTSRDLGRWLADQRKLPQYVFRPAGVAFVDHVGGQEALGLYRENPSTFLAALRKHANESSLLAGTLPDSPWDANAPSRVSRFDLDLDLALDP